MNRQMNKINRIMHAIASSRPLVVNVVINFNLTRLRNITRLVLIIVARKYSNT